MTNELSKLDTQGNVFDKCTLTYCMSTRAEIDSLWKEENPIHVHWLVARKYQLGLIVGPRQHMRQTVRGAAPNCHMAVFTF